MSNLADKLADAGIKLKSLSTGQHYTTCPECSHTRKKANQRKDCLSVKIDGEGGAVWHCNHCDWTGNVPTPREPGHKNRRHEPPPPPPPPKAPREHREVARWTENMVRFFDDRKIDREVVEEMGVFVTRIRFPQDMHLGEEEGRDGINWDKVPMTPCLAFPFTVNGKVVNHKYRDRDKRFAQDTGTVRSLYNWDDVTADDELIWVEGEMDVLAMKTAGYRQVVSLPDGAPNRLKDLDDPSRAEDKRFKPLETHGESLVRIQKHIIATDMDEPGGFLAEELSRRLGRERCYRVRWPKGAKDANDVLMKMGADAIHEAVRAARPVPIDGLVEIETQSLLRLRASPQVRTLTTGWTNVDRIVQMPERGRLWIVTGVPGSGKSEWIDALLVNMATRYGWHSTLCSPENWPVADHAAKLAEKYIGKPLMEPRVPGKWQPMEPWEVMDAEEWIQRHFAFVVLERDDQPLKLDYVLEKARQAILRYNTRAVVIDPWNEMDHSRPSGVTETEYTSSVLSRLRRFTASTNVHLFLVAHPMKLQRDKEGKIPVPGGYEISGSAHFANRGDIGVTVHRPSIDDPIAQVHVWKVRNKMHGRKGTASLFWDRLTGRYTMPASEQEHEDDQEGFL